MNRQLFLGRDGKKRTRKMTVKKPGKATNNAKKKRVSADQIELDKMEKYLHDLFGMNSKKRKVNRLG
jgi:hypothetical protein